MTEWEVLTMMLMGLVTVAAVHLWRAELGTWWGRTFSYVLAEVGR